VLANSDRQNVNDTGVRDYDEMESSDQLRLVNLNNYITRHFKNFVVDANKESMKLTFVDPKSGTHNSINIKANYDGNKVSKVEALIDNQLISLDKLSGMFKQSTILTAYLQDNLPNVTASNIIISSDDIKKRLSTFMDNTEIMNIIDNWYEQHLIKEIGSDKYASNYSLEELLSNTVAKLLSNEDQKEVLIAKQYFGDGSKLVRQAAEDTGVREVEEYVTNETLVNSANNFLSKYFNNFKPLGLKFGDGFVNYSVELFDDNTGLKSAVNFSFNVDGNTITACKANLNGQEVKIENVIKAFAMNEALSKYLELNPGKRKNAPMIMTVGNLRRKMASVTNAGLNEIEDVITNWEKIGRIDRIALNLFASQCTFEQLISMSNIKPLSDDEIKEKIARAQRDKGLQVTSAHIQDQNARPIIETWSPERMLIHAKTQINKFAKDFDILNFELNEDLFTITARIVNPTKGIREKITLSFNNNNGRLEEYSKEKVEEIYDKLSESNDEALTQYMQHNAVNQRQYKNLISKTQLHNKLASVIDVNQLDQITDSLVQYQILNPLNSSTFASDYSIAEIVTHLSRFGNTDLQSAKDLRSISKRNDDSIQIDAKRTMDNDTRQLEVTECLSPNMINLKSKIQATAEKACNQKVITANKLNQITNLLSQAKNEIDLEIAWKELKKYL
jgi:hypothetical protein